ncbi:hypothetical protein Leryth_005448 [Lithospermum erythrorhizon]|nr:hypothetical protein Leryth_005448 [Lithospermum erythrorhizon]
MALETLTSSELLNFIILETLSATQFNCNVISSENKILVGNNYVPKQESQQALDSSCDMPIVDNKFGTEKGKKEKILGVQGGKKKRRRRQKMCKNKEEAENQRMTHIVVERNRRKQMNEHLTVLRSLMPESYVQRGDQASIVGGAIEFVKRLEHTLQSLESEKFQFLKHGIITTPASTGVADAMSNVTTTTTTTTNAVDSTMAMPDRTPFARFFSYPQYTCSQSPQKIFTSKNKGAIGDIEVTLIETHANVRILSQRRVRQLSKLVAAFQSLYLTILHLNVTTLDPLVLYSISAKVEEGCQFGSANDIASAINHILRIIEEEATLYC